MKAIKNIASLLLTLVMLLSFSVAAFAHTSEPEDESDSVLEALYNENYRELSDSAGFDPDYQKDYILNGKFTLRNDADINESRHLYLKPGSVFVIKNGAKLTLNGSLVIEKGAKLYITDGSIVSGIKGMVCNYGTLVIRKKGVLTAERSFSSCPGASLKLQGSIRFGTISESLPDIADRIKEYDEKFELSDYSVSFLKILGIQTIALTYCIGDTETDHFYKFTVEKDPGTKQVSEKLTHSDYSLKKVYNDSTRNKILKAAEKYLKKNNTVEKLADNKYNFGINAHFLYSYKTNELTFCCWYITVGLSDSEAPDGSRELMYYDSGYEKKVKLG